MSKGKLYKLKDVNGNIILPVSVFDAIFNSEGKNLNQILEILNTNAMSDVAEDGFYVVDGNGYIMLKITSDGIDAAKSDSLAKKIKIGDALIAAINGVIDLSSFITGTNYDKNLILMGDSITNFGEWQAEFAKHVSFKTTTNLAIGGAKWSCASAPFDESPTQAESSGNVIWNQFNWLNKKIEDQEIASADVIIIFAGANERYTNDTTRGTVADAFNLANDYSSMTTPDSTINTMCKAIRYTLEKIITTYPNAEIFICTPTRLVHTSTEYSNLEKVAELTRQCAIQMGLKIIDLYAEAGINHITDSVDLRDGLHLSSVGGIKVGKTIALGVKSGLLI